MNKPMKILLPTDFSETAQNAYLFALALTKALKGKLSILHAVYPEYAPMDLPVVSASDTQLKAELARTAMDAFISLGQARLQLEQENPEAFEVHAEVEVGNPPATILRTARRDQVDLIIMGTKGKHSLLEKTFGSVTTEVISKAEVPVIVIPEEARFQAFKRIAVATDLRPEEYEPLVSILDLLSPIDAEIQLVHIHHSSKGVSEEEEALQRLQTLFSNYGKNAPAVLKISPEGVVDSLEDYTNNYGIDLLIMLGHHRTVWERLFYRSKTRQMVFQSNVPLLIYPVN